MRVMEVGEVASDSNRERVRLPGIGLDVRALGMFRVGVGLFLIFNLIQYRLLALESFYFPGDRIVPGDVWARRFGQGPTLLPSLESDWAITAFFLVLVIAAVLYTVGYRARWTGMVSLIGLWSVINATPFAVHAVETLIEVSLFWGLFLPLDRSFSLFSSRSAPAQLEVRSLASCALIFQIGLIYITGSLTKHGEFWQSGLTIESLLDDRTHAGLLAHWLVPWPELCAALSYASIVLELVIGLLILCPVWTWATRLLAAVLVVALHVPMGLTLNVGAFYANGLIFAIVLTPTWVWDRLRVPPTFRFARVREKSSRIPMPSGLLKAARVAVSVVLVFGMLWIFQKNLNQWSRGSYLSEFLAATPIVGRVAAFELPIYGHIGIVSQPWLFFAPDPSKEMGTIFAVGITEDGRSIDLRSGEVLLLRDPISGRNQLVREPWNQFTGTGFVFSWYARRLVGNLDREVWRRWTRYEFRRWRQHHPDFVLEAASLLYYSNPTRIEGGVLQRKPGLKILAYLPLEVLDGSAPDVLRSRQK